ncbi:uncharacterized protein LOC106874312 isoform X1 [Octopus bimaculoides]|nr:uncharacterized protein LOC106874312 isoform X1 [Octopus bimaculoides]
MLKIIRGVNSQIIPILSFIMNTHNNTRKTTDVSRGPICEQHKRCKNGSCVSDISLCSDKEDNVNTILVMIIIGLAIVIFLTIVYCLQQRGRHRAQTTSDSQMEVNSSADVESDNLSLYQPPPPYEEVISTNRYPMTPERQRMQSFSLNVPVTPPPNYETALNILARSQEIVNTKPSLSSSPSHPDSMRRCRSEDILSPQHLRDNLPPFTYIPQLISNTNYNNNNNNSTSSSSNR